MRSRIKSNMKHPYMKSVIPFWRTNEPGSLMTYSEETKEALEKFKAEFDNSCKYIQWIHK